MGAFDNLWHHEWQAKLPQRHSARYELALHAAREAIYGVVFIGLAWWQWQGGLALLFAGLLVAELLITLADFLEEDRSRTLPPFERVLHTLLTISCGLFLALLLVQSSRHQRATLAAQRVHRVGHGRRWLCGPGLGARPAAQRPTRDGVGARPAPSPPALEGLGQPRVGGGRPGHRSRRDPHSRRGAPGRRPRAVATEHEAQRLGALGVRVVCLRFGVVLGQGGGAYPMQALASWFGLGAVLGSGQQAAPWVHLQDAVGLIRFAMQTPGLQGPVNAVAPQAVNQAAFASALAASFGRHVRLQAPAWPLRRLGGEMTSLLLDGQQVLPQRAMAAGYRFRFASLDAALADLGGARAKPGLAAVSR